MLALTDELQQRLFSVAYKMTGERHSSQDICQTVWERYWGLTPDRHASIQDPTAYLCRMVIHAALDHLKQVQQERAHYPGTWLPEPIAQEMPQHQLDVSYGLTVLLSRLTPIERAVFILRASFEVPYQQIGAWLQLSPDHARQLYHRASPKLQRPTAQALAHPDQQRVLLQAFEQAATEGNLTPLLDFLQADVALYSDGGGKVAAARRVLNGATTVRAFLLGLYQKFGGNWQAQLQWVNNQQGIFLYEGNVLNTILLLDVTSDGIESIYLLRNPDKLPR